MKEFQALRQAQLQAIRQAQASGGARGGIRQGIRSGVRQGVRNKALARRPWDRVPPTGNIQEDFWARRHSHIGGTVRGGGGGGGGNYGIPLPYGFSKRRTEAPQEVVATAHPVVDTPVATAMDVPEVVEQEPVPKEPTEGVDYMSSGMKNTYDQMQDYNIGFKPEDWIAKTSKSDIDKQQLAQKLADTYKFKINEQLKQNDLEERIKYKALARRPWDRVPPTGNIQEDFWARRHSHIGGNDSSNYYS